MVPQRTGGSLAVGPFMVSLVSAPQVPSAAVLVTSNFLKLSLSWQISIIEKIDKKT